MHYYSYPAETQTYHPSVAALVPSDRVNSLIEEIKGTGEQGQFERVMENFNEYFVDRFLSRNPVQKGQFPFGSVGQPPAYPKPVPPPPHNFPMYPAHYSLHHYPQEPSYPMMGDFRRVASHSRLSDSHQFAHSMAQHSMGPHTMGPHTMGPHTMGPHTMGLHTMGQHSMGRHSMSRHSMGRHTPERGRYEYSPPPADHAQSWGRSRTPVRGLENWSGMRREMETMFRRY